MVHVYLCGDLFHILTLLLTHSIPKIKRVLNIKALIYQLHKGTGFLFSLSSFRFYIVGVIKGQVYLVCFYKTLAWLRLIIELSWLSNELQVVFMIKKHWFKIHGKSYWSPQQLWQAQIIQKCMIHLCFSLNFYLSERGGCIEFHISF